MVGRGLLFGAMVLLAGILIMVGLITLTRGGGIWLLLGFVLIAACALLGTNPSFLSSPRRPRS